MLHPLTNPWASFAAIVALLLPLVPARAAAPTPQDLEFFEKKVRPLMVAHCLECHSGDDPDGKLNMESLGGLLSGGLRGPALVPGKPDKSLLVTAIRHNEELKMPPKQKLSTSKRAILTAWVKRGAPWPNAKSTNTPLARPKTPGGPLFSNDQLKYWAFQPLVATNVPSNSAGHWANSAIDQFVLARLNAAGLQPAPPATRLAWLRRVTFDLTGLPPTPEQINRFLTDDTPEARARVVDQLLTTPSYGERWGRHWLDVARYADSNGLDENLCYGNAFRYRDYVIGAFNEDLPYDQFVQEQLAGDLMSEEADIETTLKRIIATGFLVLGPKMLAEDDPRKMQMDIIDEQLDTIGKTFLGLTFGCARCHDHKFDPIPTADYYALAGILKSTKTMENFRVVAKWNETQLASAESRTAQALREKKIGTAKQLLATSIQAAKQDILKSSRRRAGDYLLVATVTWMKSQLLTGRKPLGDTPKGIKQPGVIVREAESYNRGNAAKLATGYGKGIGVIASGSGLSTAEYDVTVEKGGTFRLEVRQAAAQSRPCRILVNGGLAHPGALGRTTGSWYPDTQKWGVEALAELKAGKNTIRIERQGPFPHIDKFLLAPITDTGTGPIHTLSQLASKIANRDALQPAILQQWVAHLTATRNDKSSPLALWHHAVSGSTSSPPTTGPRLGQHAKHPLDTLATSYAALFTMANDLWLKQVNDKNTKPLADPELESLRNVLYSPSGPYKASKEIEAAFDKQTTKQLDMQRASLKALESAKPTLPTAMAVADGPTEDLKVHIRGSYLTLGPMAPRGFPRILAGEKQARLPKKTSGRLELATWMTRPDNPLVPRVIANRIWRWHFGHGLVRSTDNFGTLGDRPTHPGLLDWLASELIRRNWSMKSLHREILLSQTYAMSTRFNPKAADIDPENQLQWRMDRRRLSAEEVRDSLLFVGGRLDRRIGGSLMTVKNRAYVTGTGHNMKTDVYQNDRRSIYQPVVRSALFEVFQAFDFADPSLPNGDRVTTTIAPQALFLMNSLLVDNQSKHIADRILAANDDDPARLKRLYESLLGRSPTPRETNQAATFLSEYRRAAVEDDKNSSDKKDDAQTAPPRVRAWRALCRVLLSSTEFVYTE